MGPDKPLVNQPKKTEDFTKDVTEVAELKPTPMVTQSKESEKKPEEVHIFFSFHFYLSNLLRFIKYILQSSKSFSQDVD